MGLVALGIVVLGGLTLVGTGMFVLVTNGSPDNEVAESHLPAKPPHPIKPQVPAHTPYVSTRTPTPTAVPQPTAAPIPVSTPPPVAVAPPSPPPVYPSGEECYKKGYDIGYIRGTNHANGINDGSLPFGSEFGCDWRTSFDLPYEEFDRSFYASSEAYTGWLDGYNTGWGDGYDKAQNETYARNEEERTAGHADGYAVGYEEGYLCDNTSRAMNIETGNFDYDTSYSLGWHDGYSVGVDDYVADGGLNFC